MGQGKGGGRPRIYDLDEMADKLDAWSRLPDSWSLNAFCADNDIACEYISVWANENERFSQVYKQTRSKIAARREQKASTGEMYFGVFNMYQRHYDTVLKSNEKADKQAELDQQLEFEKKKLEHAMKLRSDTDRAVSEETAAQFAQLMSEITSRQIKD